MPIIKADEDSDMYGGGDDTPAQDKRASPKQAKAMDEDMETAILPKSMLLGKEISPGDKVILRVLEMGDEDFTVQYKKEDKKDKKDDKDDDDSDDKDDDRESITAPEEEIVVDEMDSIFS